MDITLIYKYHINLFLPSLSPLSRISLLPLLAALLLAILRHYRLTYS